MEIFDVSRADPSLLDCDQLGVNYQPDQVIRHNAFSSDNLAPASLHPARHRHSSEPVRARSKMRHYSGPGPAVNTTRFRGNSLLQRIIISVLVVGDSDDSGDETHCDNFSDPEADWVTETIQS